MYEAWAYEAVAYETARLLQNSAVRRWQERAFPSLRLDSPRKNSESNSESDARRAYSVMRRGTREATHARIPYLNSRGQ